ncbi:MAG: FAD-dependent oxidoreductase [Chthoniobacterales bacterium]
MLVAGGGSAGLAAAISAARAGAKTLLVEHGGSLGGMATASLVHSICGLYRITSEKETAWANPGFPKEFAVSLIEMGGARGPIQMGRVDVLLTDPTAFSLLADTLVLATPNLQMRLHSTIIRADSNLTQLEMHTRGRTEIIRPQAVVDATGDGTVASLAGAAFEQTSAEKMQRSAFIFGLQGIADNFLTDDARLKISRNIAAAVQAGNLTQTALGATLRSSGRRAEAYVSIDLPGLPNYDPLDAACLTQLEIEGRLTAAALALFLKEHVAGFGESFISLFPLRVGVRESRRITGRYCLEAADLENGATFSDAVALATWPMELRETATGPRLRYHAGNRPCEIPLRALQARDRANLFMAGRCISASHEAQASIRVIGTCLATGEAAGIAAAKLVR